MIALKKKLIAFVLFVLVIFVSAFANNMSKGKSSKRIHQHLHYPKPTEACLHTDEELCTHLPLVIIDTSGIDIPGEVYKEDGRTKYTLTEDGERMLASSIRIIDNEKSYNHPGDEPAIDSTALIRIRGNTSRHFDKKNYLIRFVNGEGYKHVKVMGMEPHYEWALHGPYLDKTLIRNYMWYNIAGEIMDYAPNVRFCEVILNGEYLGLYLMTETITSSKNARLKLSEPIGNTGKTGYVIRLDRGSTNEFKNITAFTNYALRNYHVLDVEYPRASTLTQEMKTVIEREFSDFEKALYSYDYDSKKHGYRKYVDVDSFVDYFIINEFTSNYDAVEYSTYIYKDVGGKYKFVIWDFNSAHNNYQDDILDPFKFAFPNKVWYFMLMKDEYFCNKVIDRYRELRKWVLSDEYLANYIDSVIKYLGEAIVRNFDVWGYSFDLDLVAGEDRNPKSHGEAVMLMRQHIMIRGAWLDEHIEVIKQYGHESKVKKFNH